MSKNKSNNSSASAIIERLNSFPKVSGLSLDPPTNRGSECQSVSVGYISRVDWVQGVISLESIYQRREILDRVMLPGDQILTEGDPFHSGKRWDHSGKTLWGLRYFWDDPTEQSEGKLLLMVPGDYLSRMDAQSVWLLCRYLKLEQKFKATRFDMAVDDYSKAVMPSEVAEAGRAGNFGYFRRRPHIQEDSHTGGVTVRFGSRAADKELRVYDKSIESKGEIDSIRWELEARDEVADAHLCRFVDCPWEELPYEFLLQAVFGSVEFCDRSDPSLRLDRCQRLEWWEAMLNQVFTVRLPVPKPRNSLERSMGWIERQVSGSLRVLEAVIGPGQLWDFICEITDPSRLTKNDDRKIKAYRADVQADAVLAELNFSDA